MITGINLQTCEAEHLSDVLLHCCLVAWKMSTCADMFVAGQKKRFTAEQDQRVRETIKTKKTKNENVK